MEEYEKRRLEKLVEDPLAAFDEVNNNAWKNKSDPEVSSFIKNIREKIINEEDRGMKYSMVVAYMSALREKVCDDSKSFLEYTINNIRIKDYLSHKLNN